MSIPNTFRPVCGPAGELPPGFRRLAAISAPGNANDNPTHSIDTGVVPTLTTIFEATITYTELGENVMYNGAATLDIGKFNDCRFHFGVGKAQRQFSALMFDIYGVEGIIYGYPTQGRQYTLKLDANTDSLHIDGTAYVVPYQNKTLFNVTSALLLFARSRSGRPDDQHHDMRLHRARIWDGGELVRNLVPARRDADGVCGMFDTVQSDFLTNATSNANFLSHG